MSKSKLSTLQTSAQQKTGLEVGTRKAKGTPALVLGTDMPPALGTKEFLAVHMDILSWMSVPQFFTP